MSPLRRWFGYLAAVAVLLAVPSDADAQGLQECTRWTPWSPVHPLDVLWSWRMCPTTGGRYDIHWRFSNVGRADIEFEYQLFTGRVTECSDRNRGRVFAQGRVELNGGERQELPEGRRRHRRSGFDNRFVLFLCLKPDSY